MDFAEPAWDPLSVLPVEERGRFRDGLWDKRCELNVPGPFYTAETDNCWTGRLSAPRNVMYGGEYLTEYVFRQPRDPAEVAAVASAAEDDPFGEYGCDGDERWTPELVREWWRTRDRVIASVTETMRQLDARTDRESHEAADGAREFLAYIAGGLEHDLRAYVFRLQEGRYPQPGEPLPGL